MNVSLRVHSEIDSVCLSVTTIFKRVDGLGFYFKFLMLFINGFVSTSSTNKWKAFLKFQIRFPIIDRKPKNIGTNSVARILIKSTDSS